MENGFLYLLVDGERKRIYMPEEVNHLVGYQNVGSVSKPQVFDVLDLLENLGFFLPEKEDTDEILALNEEMNREYRERQFQRVFRKDGELRETENTKELNPEDFKRSPEDVSWHKRLLAGLSSVLFHKDNEPEISDEEFSSFFQKDVAERIFDHLAMLARGYKEGNEPLSIMRELTEGIVSVLGLKLARHENTPEEFKKRTGRVLHRVAWDFQNWLLYIQHGHYPAMFGGIYTQMPAQMPQKGNVLLLDPDVEEPADSNEPKVIGEYERAAHAGYWVSLDEIRRRGLIVPEGVRPLGKIRVSGRAKRGERKEPEGTLFVPLRDRQAVLRERTMGALKKRAGKRKDFDPSKVES